MEDKLIFKKFWLFRYERVGVLSILTIHKYAIYKRVGNLTSIFGIAFTLKERV